MMNVIGFWVIALLVLSVVACIRLALLNGRMAESASFARYIRVLDDRYEKVQELYHELKKRTETLEAQQEVILRTVGAPIQEEISSAQSEGDERDDEGN